MSGPLILIGALLAFFLWKYYGRGAKKLFVSSVSGAASGGGTSAVAPAPGPVEEKWFVKHWGSIALVLAGAAVFFWGLYTPGLKAADIGSWSWDHWFQILVFCGILTAVVRLNARPLGELSGTIQTATVVTLLVLFLGFPTWSWITSSSSSGCVSGHPCVLSQDDDGSSNVVTFQDGQAVCFDEWHLKHLGETGMMISYRDPKGPGEPFPCTREQIILGTCVAVYDRFWFKPPKKTRLPNYWFVASGSKKC